jgi:hypothetical protein
MKPGLRKLLVLFLVVAIFCTTAFTWQEENLVKIKHMEIDLWPEYDRSQLLVIYRIQLSNDTPLPARVSLRIPNTAGTPYKVATRDLDGLLYNIGYSLEPEGSWNVVVLTTSSNELYIEHYVPSIISDEDSRSFTFSWICDYPIDELLVKMQQPRYSKDFSTTPFMGLGELNIADGLLYFKRDFGSLASGITFTTSATYTRTSNELSASNLPVVAATPIIQNSGWGHTVSNVMTQVLDNRSMVVAGSLILAGIVLMLLVSVLAGFWKGLFSNGFGKTKSQGDPSEDLEVRVQYCTHCGKRTNPGDRYCRGCGNTV